MTPQRHHRSNFIERFSVDSRILYENGSVDANRSMRFWSCKNACKRKRTGVDEVLNSGIRAC